MTKFASNCGIPQGTLAGYKKGRLPSPEHLIRIRECCSVSVDWLLTGAGEKYVSNDPTKHHLDPDPEIANLLEGARQVLTSGNPIAFDALKSNIRYFSHAIAVEERNEKMAAQIDEMSEQIENLKKSLTESYRENARIDSDAEEQSSNKKIA